MIDAGIVRGSKESAEPLIVGPTTVYVHTDIHEVEVEDTEGEKRTEWEYHEYTYSKDEYIKMMSDENANLKSKLEATQEAVDYLLMEEV